MKKCLEIIFLLIIIFLYSAPPSHASTTLLHEFAGGSNDGYYPYGGLSLSNGVLYGMTWLGGTSDAGTIFSVNTDGTNYTVLRKFAVSASDGRFPNDSLTVTDTKIYGMTYFGGTIQRGTIFSMNKNGTDFSLLHSFVGGANDGYIPYGNVTLSGTKLYGMTCYGGDSNMGTIFSINTDGTGFTLLHEFAGGGTDGKCPYGSLTLENGIFYGTTLEGGDSNMGTIFSINTDGTGFTLLHEFAGGGADGSDPYGNLILVSNKLYGYSYEGGDANLGTIFSINPDGTGFTLLHEFSDTAGDACWPGYGSLYHLNGIFYGLASYCGASNKGAIYAINIDGTNFTLLHEFVGGANDGNANDGGNGVIISNGIMYGMTVYGGDSNLGTIFSFVVPDITPPSLSLTPLSPDPTTDTTPSVAGTATDVSGTVSAVEYQVDSTSGSWTTCTADDGIFDEASESFVCTSTTLADGEHTMYVRATDNSANTTSSGAYSSDTFTLDTTSSAYQDIHISQTETTGTIVYTTSEAISTQAEWGTSTSYGTVTTETDTSPRVTSHTVSLSGLTKCTDYHLRLLGSDAAGNSTPSTDQTFRTTGCIAQNEQSDVVQIRQVTSENGGGGVMTPTKEVNTGNQKVFVIIEPKTMNHDAFLSAVKAEPAQIIQTSTTSSSNTTSSSSPTSPKTNAILAGGGSGILGIKTGGRLSWQVGSVQQMWYKTYPPENSTAEPARIIPELQNKPSIVALSYTHEDLIPPGQPTKKFNAKNLKLAYSTDGITWKILPTSVVDPTNHTVAALHKLGGYYMIVGR